MGAIAKAHRRVRRLVAAVCALLAVYSVVFIARTSWVVEGQRYFSLFDDALISMRYAKHWAAGQGLVWNIGERVEGYSNFAWVAVMAVIHLIVDDPSRCCLVVQIIGYVVVVGIAFATVRLARATRAPPVAAAVAAILTVLQYNLCFLSLTGMETAALALVLTLGQTAAANGVRRQAGRISSMAWFCVAVLLRPDALMLAVMTAGWLLLTVRRGRLRILLGMALVGTVVAGQMLWRHAYYGAWAPNTYYLKLTGWPLADRLSTGFDQLGWLAGPYLAPALLAAIGCLRRRFNILLVLSFLALAAYQTWIGGDAWFINRLVLPATPGLFVAAAVGLEKLLALIELRRWTALRIAGVAVLFVAVNGLVYRHVLMMVNPLQVDGNGAHLRLWRAIERVSEPQASVAVGWAGLIPYFSDRYSVDLLGKCDPRIAREQVDPSIRRSGHNKMDLAYSIATYSPEIVVDVIQAKALEADYRAVRVEVDDAPVAFMARRSSPLLHHMRGISLPEAAAIRARDLRSPGAAAAPP